MHYFLLVYLCFVPLCRSQPPTHTHPAQYTERNQITKETIRNETKIRVPVINNNLRRRQDRGRVVEKKNNDLLENVERKYEEIMKLLKIVANIKMGENTYTDVSTILSPTGHETQHEEKGIYLEQEKINKINKIKVEEYLKEKIKEITERTQEELLKELRKIKKKLQGMQNIEEMYGRTDMRVKTEDSEKNIEEITYYNNGREQQNYLEQDLREINKKKDKLEQEIRELKRRATQNELKMKREEIEKRPHRKKNIRSQENDKKNSAEENQLSIYIHNSTESNNSNKNIKKSAEDNNSHRYIQYSTEINKSNTGKNILKANNSNRDIKKRVEENNLNTDLKKNTDANTDTETNNSAGKIQTRTKEMSDDKEYVDYEERSRYLKDIQNSEKEPSKYIEPFNMYDGEAQSNQNTNVKEPTKYIEPFKMYDGDAKSNQKVIQKDKDKAEDSKHKPKNIQQKKKQGKDKILDKFLKYMEKEDVSDSSDVSVSSSEMTSLQKILNAPEQSEHEKDSEELIFDLKGNSMKVQLGLF